MAYPTGTGFRAMFAQVVTLPSRLPLQMQDLLDSGRGQVISLPLNPGQEIQQAEVNS